MKYLKRFTNKQAYKNDIMPQVSILLNENEVLFDSAKQVVNISNLNTDLKNINKDYYLNGSIDSKVLSISGKSVEMTNVSVNGTINKEDSNAAVVLNQATIVDITNSKFNASTYNMIEIGLIGERVPNQVNISDCDFAVMSNNAISIHGFADNAVVNIKNCNFEEVSNCLRISNRTNAKNITINIEDCTCDKWDPREYGGFVLFQEYPAGQLGFENITLNIKNLVGPNGKITGTPESICGTKDANQVIYVYSNNAVQSYNSNIYPKININ